MASTDPAQSEPATAPGTMALNGLQAVGTTAGNEATTRSKQWRQPTAVETDQADHQLGDGPAEALPNGLKEADR